VRTHRANHRGKVVVRHGVVGPAAIRRVDVRWGIRLGRRHEPGTPAGLQRTGGEGTQAMVGRGSSRRQARVTSTGSERESRSGRRAKRPRKCRHATTNWRTRRGSSRTSGGRHGPSSDRTRNLANPTRARPSGRGPPGWSQARRRRNRQQTERSIPHTQPFSRTT